MSSSTAVDRPPLSAITSPPTTGQHTAVEAARAVAEVQGAIVVAQQVPRNLARADAEMRRSCSKLSMAERAFFAFPRAGQQITGASVHLARELARCWGNIQYGVTELSRDDRAGASEMLAWAWDVEANTRAETRFIVKHQRDTRDRGAVDLTDLRDIYENNANAGARRLREMVFAVLPQWFTEEAQNMCRQTLADGDGSPFEQRVQAAVDAWGTLGVTELMLTDRLQVPRVAWTPQNLATLAVLWQTVARGESTVAVEFDTGAGRPKLADIAGQAPGPHARAVQVAPPAERSDGVADRPVQDVPLPGEQPGEQPARAERSSPPRPPDNRPATRVQQAAIRTRFDDLQLDDTARLLVVTNILDRQPPISMDQLTRDDAALILDNIGSAVDALGLGLQPSEAEQAAAFEAEQQAIGQAAAEAEQQAAAGEQGDPWGAPAGGDQA